MKKTLFFLVLLAWLPGRPAFAQIDTTVGRYHQPVFTTVTVTPNVVFGAGTRLAGASQTLLMDIYEPAGDTVTRRPLLIMAHEGAFVGGTKNDPTMTELCTRFARLGYVTASIDYRLLNILQLLSPADTINLAKGALLAMQDMRAAVRFFRRDAATSRQYRVHPDYIFIGGSSAGAIVALQAGYLDKLAEVPAYYTIDQLGGLEGNSGSAGYSSRARGVINLCGALGRREWLEPGDMPFVSLHGTADGTVPYGVGTPGLLLPPQRLYGSGSIKLRADAVGVQNNLYSFKGAGHVPFNSNPLYMDTTFRYVRDFLRPVLAQPGTIVTGAWAVAGRPGAQVFPVPATDAVQLRALDAASFRPQEMVLVDATGRVVRRFWWGQPAQQLPRGALRAGVYVLQGTDGLRQRVLFD